MIHLPPAPEQKPCRSNSSDTGDLPIATDAIAGGSAYQPQIAALLAQAQRAGLRLRGLPAKPLTCCGRGCNGCVWEGYFMALKHWCEDAQVLLNSYQINSYRR